MAKGGGREGEWSVKIVVRVMRMWKRKEDERGRGKERKEEDTPSRYLNLTLLDWRGTY